MIVDFHTHVAGGLSEKFITQWLHKTHFGDMPAWFKDWKDKWKPEDFHLFYADRYVEEMEEKGIDWVCTWQPTMHPYEMRQDIDFVLEFAKRHEKRVIPFFGADAMGGHEEAARLEFAIKELGFRATKIYPTYSWLNPDDPRIFPLYEKCAELDIPCILHTGFTFSHGAFLKHHRPEYLDAICYNFPELKLVAAHCGFQWAQDLFTLMFAHKNLHADLAWFMIYPLDWLGRIFAWAKHWGLIDRIMYGSDYPLTDPKTEGIDVIQKVKVYQEQQNLVPALDDADVAMIMGGNAQKMLGL